MKFLTVIHKVLIERSVSQIFCLGFSSHFMLKNVFVNFLYFLRFIFFKHN